ncbi:hypothetical protein PVL29_006475 [Vitis rotundifolia]|uniref:Uncharacterized protein n=1 Tax=Vitis rotundifolia TaxID=103349 RepID=A0AA39A797_VITRO|nr:hypothetical protein PVL29_006475 [Vitis rotundifolia]
MVWLEERQRKGRWEGKLLWSLMKLRLLSWNVRGMHDPDKRMVIKSMVRKHKLDLVCFQETKMKEMSDRIVRSLGIGRNLGWASLYARGSAGGVLVMWDKRVLEGLEVEVGSFSISCRFRNCEEGSVWVFSGLYGPTKGRERRELWEELAAVKGLWDDPWCIAGDFNVVRFPVETSNGRQMSNMMREFSRFIDEFDLVDPPLGGGTFTWSGGEGGSLKARLDHFLFSGDWEDLVSRAMQFLLPRPVFDHCPILLECGGMRKGKNPFRFENMWLRVEGFMDKLKDWWQSYNFRGTPSFVLAKKLQALKYDLRMWDKETLGNVSVRKDAALERLIYWDGLERLGSLSEDDRRSQQIARDDFSHCAILEEISWKQKSRALWLKEGNSNTKFFHRMTNARRRGNFISSLIVRGVRLDKEEELKEGMGAYFKSLFEEPQGRRPEVELGLFKTLDSLDNELLEGQFSEEEVSKALSDLGGDKVPGPDGFTLAFWKFCWPIVGGEVMQVFEELHVQNAVFRSLNAMFLVLIPKKEGASDNAFVGGRQILDAVLVTNEAIDSRNRNAGAGYVCKLDIEKAYDHVNWRFLISVLEKMGFGPKWRNWIFFCISTVRMAVLVNDTPTDFFSTFRGLRQEDPLSPYLFVLIMEAFSSLISRAEEKGFIRGFKVMGRRGEGVSVSHLLFTDDTLLFCEDNRNQLDFWKWVVYCFEVVSGLKINMQKSEIIPVGGVDDLDRAAAVFGCKVGNLPTTYLSLPLGASHNSCRVWDVVEERFKRKLATWKTQYLSKGGRLTLIKSTLSNLPIYFMSLFVIPRKVRLRLEKIQREFFWGDLEERRKLHLVRWAVICKDKRHGGLGLRHLKDFNHALLGKWLWRFSLERESFWRKVNVGKFGEDEGGWTTREVRESYGLGLWKDIRKGWEEFFLRTSIRIGNGRRTRFWWDIWVGDSKLKDLYPLLFRNAMHNSTGVADLWGRQGGGGGGWEVHFRRPFQDWELDEVTRFLNHISAVKVQEGEDSLVWKIERRGKFSVKSYYRSLKDENNIFFPAKEVWGSHAPSRTRFFAWEAVWGKISIVDRLMRRGWSMVNRCILCKENEESADHILIHYGKTRELWTLLLSNFGVMWVFPASVRNLLLEWKIKGLGKKRCAVWRMVPICLFWCIWGERNRRTFQEEEMSDTSLRNLFSRSLFEWSQQILVLDYLTFLNFLGYGLVV